MDDIEGFLLFMGLILAFCSLLDWISTPEENDQNRLIITSWYTKLSDYDFASAVELINDRFFTGFRRIYGDKIFSLRRIFCSALSSLFFLYVTYIFLSGSITLPSELDFHNTSRSHIIVPFVIFLCLSNIFADYLSLIETEYLLALSNGKKLWLFPVFVAMDLVLSLVIFVAMMFFLSVVFGANGEFPVGVHNNASESFFFAALISTFFTSLAFYLCFAFNIFNVFICKFRPRLLEVLVRLESSEHMYKSLGMFIGSLVSCVKACFLFFEKVT
ncbi:hypothetical protein tinsulaeT_00030 [Thalassotalea insulae]|uniref:Uncharacterized protein n=1 Tax=Thalassotalea insulae TaxID=2056778 RepID=A0ABQ6GKZ7_9GAMM|nr:hypothetical protein [Thalassotalea insulae]GLX76663.1 hypothetical protein tinsulaeT_00030 [Thalassotalea insulae]